MESAPSILLVEPDGRRRMQLCAAICGEPRLLLAESVACGRRALERLALVRPDVVLVGAALEEPCGGEFLRVARSKAAPPEVVVTVGVGEEPAAIAWLAGGAAGCVSMSCSGAELAAHLQQLRSGASPILPSVARKLVEHMRAAPVAVGAAPSRQRGVTAREAEVLRMLSCGCTYLQAGERLGISLHTVTTHIKNAYRKLDVHSAGAAVMRAVELRIIGGSEAG
jgi:DNA-binding NarL/FixJ family response regulator